MKKLFLFLAFFFASSALAQSAKVLVCAPGDLKAAQTTESALRKFYTDSIDISDTITNAINNYQALFLIRSSFDTVTISKLKNYLKLKRSLYIEYYAEPFSHSLTNFKTDSNSFWKFIGIDFLGIDDLNFMVEDVVGINATFTEGLSVKNPNYYGQLYSTWILSGSNTPVLRTSPDGSNEIAISYETDSFKVVLHEPQTSIDYYDIFLGRVLCNYFGLCTPLSVKPSVENPQAEFSLFPNPARDVLHIWSSTDNPGLQSAELISETGSLISKFSLDGNMNHVDLDLGSKNLSSGNYFLRLRTQKESFLKPVILAK